MLSASRRCRCVSRIIVVSQKRAESRSAKRFHRGLMAQRDCAAERCSRAYAGLTLPRASSVHKRRSLGRRCGNYTEFQIHKVTLDYTSLPQPGRELQSNEARFMPSAQFDLRSPPSPRSSLAARRLRRSGPNYRPPQPVTPDEWHSLPQTGAARRSADPAALADWWKTLNDPILNQLIEQALARNKTAKQAYARVVEARARRGIAAADFWPTLGRLGRRRAAPTPSRASAIPTSACPAAATRSTTPASTPAGSSICSAASVARSKPPPRSSARAKRICATCSSRCSATSR